MGFSDLMTGLMGTTDFMLLSKEDMVLLFIVIGLIALLILEGLS